MQHRGACVVGELQRRLVGERRRIGAVEVHDLHRAEDPPPIQRGVVAEALQEVEGSRVACRAGVEVQLHVGNRPPVVVVAQHRLQIADPGVVAGEREVRASERGLRVPEISHRCGELGGGIDTVGEHAAAGEVDMHPRTPVPPTTSG
jgi:hypothetical protein